MTDKDFEKVVLQYENMIYHFIHKYRVTYDKEEYYQLALIKLWELEKSYDNKKTQCKNQFMYYRLNCYFIDLIRKSLRKAESVPIIDEHLLMDIKDSIKETELLMELEYMKEKLTQNEQLWLDFTLQGYSINEIASKVNKSPSAIKKYRQSARKKFC